MTESLLYGNGFIIFGVISLIFAGRYVVMAGAAYLICRFWLREKIEPLMIAKPWPHKRHRRRDFWYSILTSLIFGAVGWALAQATLRGYGLLYFDVARHGWGYFGFSVAALLVLHDAYFYWAHRLMHLPGVYGRIHKTHHLSRSPTPWTSFAFSPAEAALEGLIIPIAVFIMPLHLHAIVIFLYVMTFMNVLGHIGYEFYPRGFLRGWLGKWNNTATHHHMHHLYVNYNFGLYFNWWDRLLKTNHPDYEAAFDGVKEGRPVEEREEL